MGYQNTLKNMQLIYSKQYDEIEKGKKVPVGTINAYNEQKQEDGTWKYLGKKKEEGKVEQTLETIGKPISVPKGERMFTFNTDEPSGRGSSVLPAQRNIKHKGRKVGLIDIRPPHKIKLMINRKPTEEDSRPFESLINCVIGCYVINPF